MNRNIFILLFHKVCLLQPFSAPVLLAQAQKNRNGGTVHLLHLLPSPHWACSGSSQPHPAKPTRCAAATHHRFSVCGSTNLPVQQLYCCLLRLCVDITFFYPGSSEQLTFPCQSPASPLYPIGSYRYLKIPTSKVNKQSVEGRAENTAVLFGCLIQNSESVLSSISLPLI